MSAPCGICLLPPIVRCAGLVTDAFAPTSTTTASPSPSPRARVADLRAALNKLSDRKKAVTEKYLQMVEDSVDAFLARTGVHTHALSDRYLDEPPRSMDLLRRNADLLVHCTQDAFNPRSEINVQLVAPLVLRAYSEFLDPLLGEMRDFWRHYGHWASERRDGDPHQVAPGGGDELDARTRGKCWNVQRDIEHVQEMRVLDQLSAHEVAERFNGGGLSHVVPIAGLALGRVHRMLNEHNTAIAHWGAKR